MFKVWRLEFQKWFLEHYRCLGINKKQFDAFQRSDSLGNWTPDYEYLIVAGIQTRFE